MTNMDNEHMTPISRQIHAHDVNDSSNPNMIMSSNVLIGYGS